MNYEERKLEIRNLELYKQTFLEELETAKKCHGCAHDVDSIGRMIARVSERIMALHLEDYADPNSPNHKD